MWLCQMAHSDWPRQNAFTNIYNSCTPTIRKGFNLSKSRCQKGCYTNMRNHLKNPKRESVVWITKNQVAVTQVVQRYQFSAMFFVADSHILCRCNGHCCDQTPLLWRLLSFCVQRSRDRSYCLVIQPTMFNKNLSNRTRVIATVETWGVRARYHCCQFIV